MPIFEKGCRSDLCKYRLFCLTSAVCKVLEFIVCNKMVAHLINNNLILMTNTVLEATDLV